MKEIRQKSTDDEFLKEIKELNDDDFLELYQLLSVFLQNEKEKRFGHHERPEPKLGFNY